MRDYVLSLIFISLLCLVPYSVVKVKTGDRDSTVIYRYMYATLLQGRRKWGGRGGLSRPTFLGNLNYELVHSVESAIEDKRVYGNAADHDEC